MSKDPISKLINQGAPKSQMEDDKFNQTVLEVISAKDNVVKRIRALSKMGSQSVIDKIVGLMSDYTLSDDQLETIWGFFKNDRSEAGLRKSNDFLTTLSADKYIRRDISEILEKIVSELINDLLIPLSQNGNQEQKAAAKDIIFSRAQNGDAACLKHIFMTLEGDGYSYATSIIDGALKGDHLHDYYFIKHIEKVFLSCELDGLAAGFCRENIEDAKKKIYDGWEKSLGQNFSRLQSLGRLFGNNPFLSVGTLSPERAFSALGRLRVTRDYEETAIEILREFRWICGDDFEAQYIDALIERNTPKALRLASLGLFSAIKEGRAEFDTESPKLQEQKKSIIWRLARLLEPDEVSKYHCAFAQIDILADRETGEYIVDCLVTKASRGSFDTLYKILTQSFYSSDMEAVSGGKFHAVREDLREYAFRAVITSGRQDAGTYDAILKIANLLPDSFKQEAKEFFIQVGKPIALDQIRLLNLDETEDPYSHLKTLPADVAIPLLKRAFTDSAIPATPAIQAMVDMRIAAQSSGETESVAAFDGAIRFCAGKLFGKRPAALAMIKEGQRETLNSLFDQLAEQKIVDLRPQFLAACKVVDLHKQLELSKEELKKSLEDVPSLIKK